MSRTLNGNLTGKAAQLERADALEAAMDRTPFARRWGNAIDDLRELMGEDKFDEWFDSHPVDIPKGQFILVMEAQLKNLTVTEEDAGEIHAHLLTVDRNPVETAYALEFLTDSEYDDWQTHFTGRKFSPKKEAETRAWWNENYSDEAVQKRLAEHRAAALKEAQA